MSTITAKGFMFMVNECDWASGDYEKKWHPRWKEYQAREMENQIFIRPMDVEFNVPDDFNPLPKQVAAIKAAKAEVLAKYQAAVAELNERLSKLQALTYESEAA